MDIKISVNIKEGGVEKHVGFPLKGEIPPKSIDFMMNPTPERIRVININTDAYNTWTDKNSCPEWEKKSNWINMPKKKRMESHLRRIAEHFQGKVIGYQVFED